METPGAGDGIQTGWAMWQPWKEVGQELRTETSHRSCSAACCFGGLFLAWCGTGGILLSQFPPGMEGELCRAQLYLRTWKLWLEPWPKPLMCLSLGEQIPFLRVQTDQGGCWTAVKIHQSCHPRWTSLGQFEHFCFKLSKLFIWEGYRP